MQEGSCDKPLTQALWQQLLAALPKLSHLMLVASGKDKAWNGRRQDTASAAIRQLARACAAQQHHLELQVGFFFPSLTLKKPTERGRQPAAHTCPVPLAPAGPT